MWIPRFYVPLDLKDNQILDLPAAVARHVQVLRMQPGHALCVFNGQGGEYSAQIVDMGRNHVRVQVHTHQAVERELPREFHLWVGAPANDRMDWLVEKASELGASKIRPLLTERTILRFTDERAEKKQVHWQSIAATACEQCGRNRLPQVHALQAFAQALEALPKTALPAPSVASSQATASAKGELPMPNFEGLREARLVLSLAPTAVPLSALSLQDVQVVHLLNGPEGGLSPAEEALAVDRGFLPTRLGPSVLRAETAAIAALARLAI